MALGSFEKLFFVEVLLTSASSTSSDGGYGALRFTLGLMLGSEQLLIYKKGYQAKKKSVHPQTSTLSKLNLHC